MRTDFQPSRSERKTAVAERALSSSKKKLYIKVYGSSTLESSPTTMYKKKLLNQPVNLQEGSKYITLSILKKANKRVYATCVKVFERVLI